MRSAHLIVWPLKLMSWVLERLTWNWSVQSLCQPSHNPASQTLCSPKPSHTFTFWISHMFYGAVVIAMVIYLMFITYAIYLIVLFLYLTRTEQRPHPCIPAGTSTIVQSSVERLIDDEGEAAWWKKQQNY